MNLHISIGTPSITKRKKVSIQDSYIGPDEISHINGGDNWIYKRSKTQYQNLAIGISKDNKVTGFAY
jgi:hypothetical protein